MDVDIWWESMDAMVLGRVRSWMLPSDPPTVEAVVFVRRKDGLLLSEPAWVRA